MKAEELHMEIRTNTKAARIAMKADQEPRHKWNSYSKQDIMLQNKDKYNT